MTEKSIAEHGRYYDGKLNLKAYWYSFNPTGCELVDVILSRVAGAGKAFHDTAMWMEDYDTGLDRRSEVQRIQDCARAVAGKVEEVEREARHTKRILAYLYIHADLAPHHRGMVNEALGYPSFDEMEEMSQ